MPVKNWLQTNDYHFCLQELNRTCRAMQQRVLELIERVANEEVVGKLHVSDLILGTS